MKKRILIALLSFVILLIGCGKADEELSETVALGIEARLRSKHDWNIQTSLERAGPIINQRP